jgi:hypothetical protein
MAGHFGVPIRRASLSTVMLLIDDMDSVLCGWQDAMLRHVASWGDRCPHERE